MTCLYYSRRLRRACSSIDPAESQFLIRTWAFAGLGFPVSQLDDSTEAEEPAGAGSYH